jgi:GT2 family glycosyltransferase
MNGFSIVIVVWKNQEQAQELVDSIRDNSYYKGHQIIVICNEVSALTHKIPIINGSHAECYWSYNIGLSKAANHGAFKATKDYICLIDDDMTVLPDWDKHLFDAHKKTGSNWVATTCIEPIAPHYNISTKCWDYLQIKRDPLGKLIWYHNISNTPLLIPTKFWREIGGYDEDFPNSGAELGLAKRAYDHGERDFVQTPYSLVHHKQSQSMNRLPGLKKARKDRDTKFKEKYNMARKEFTTLIGKGEVYNMSKKIWVTGGLNNDVPDSEVYNTNEK